MMFGGKFENCIDVKMYTVTVRLALAEEGGWLVVGPIVGCRLLCYTCGCLSFQWTMSVRSFINNVSILVNSA